MNQMQKSTYKATENKNDVVLLSPTGSGKTLAFLFPVLRNLKRQVRDPGFSFGTGKRIGITDRTSLQSDENRLQSNRLLWRAR